MNPPNPISLSATSFNLFDECPRCFWLEHNVVKRPEGIKAGLLNGVDRVLKAYFDQFRGSLPPELRGRVEGELIADQARLDAWRDRFRGLTYADPALNARLRGLLDDCLVAGGAYVPLDYKTKGRTPAEDAHRWNQHQLDVYSLLLEANGFPSADFGYLIFYHPVEAREGGLIQFEITPRKVTTSKEAAKKLLADAVGLIRGPAPPRHQTCEYCAWGAKTTQVI